MNREHISFFHRWFDDYVGGFHSDDPLVRQNIGLKKEHTKRVCENMFLIASSLKFTQEQTWLAEVVALFHDVGRFEQFSKYGTFRDSKSEDHGLLGMNILKNSGVLSSLSEQEQSIILKAVRFHNLLEIPAGESDDVMLYSRMIRDADKLDILRVVTQHYGKRDQHPNTGLELGLPDDPGYSDRIIRDILDHRMSLLGNMKTLNDMKLLQLTWFFDINFPVTYLRILEGNYLDRIVSTLPDTEDIRKVYSCIKEFLENKVKEQ